MSTDIVAFIEARLSEREHVARQSIGSRTLTNGTAGGEWHQTDPDREAGRIEDERGEVVVYDEGSPNGWQAEHIVLNDPRYVLDDMAAKRALLARHTGVHRCDGSDYTMPGWTPPCQAQRLLAQPFRSHPDFDPAWGAR